jgi:hypothetical protein
VTIEEQLELLEDSFRRLKIEYDIYFAGGSKRPPTDLQSRVDGLVRQLSENGRLNYGHRYKLNSVAQRYSVFGDLWRRKARIKDEGYRRPEDMLVGVGGFGKVEDKTAPPAPRSPFDESEPESFMLFSDDVIEMVALYESVVRAREITGQPLGGFDTFANFVQSKSNQLRQQYECNVVEYTVFVKDGQVKLKARPRKDV